MKKVKSLLALLLVTVMVFALCGCGEQTTEPTATPEPQKTETPVESFVIAMDTSFKPFEYMDEAGNFVGIDVDLLGAIAEDQGIELKINSIGFDPALNAVISGQADGIMAGCSITEPRKETFDFSDPYFSSSVVMGIASNSTIASYADLKGKTVAVKSATEGATFAESIAEKYGFKIMTFDDSIGMYQAVTSKNAVACFEDTPVLNAAIAGGLALKTVTEPEQMSAYGFGVKKGQNAELLAYFNAGLANIKANGIYDEIFAKYDEE